MSRPILSFENTTRRAFDGAIVTFVNREDGELRVVHRAGFTYEAWTGRVHGQNKGGHRVKVSLNFLDVMRSLMTEADGWEGDWKVVTICTPASIYADLTRPVNRPGIAPHYEASVLQRIERIDMWDGLYTKELYERRRARGVKLRPDRERRDDAPDGLQGNTSTEVGEGSEW